MKPETVLLGASLWGSWASSILAGAPTALKRQNMLQNVVTFDEHSILIHGERLFLYSGEFHPFRLPVPDLWLDVFQKIKSLGFNGVSFYVDWALVEGKQGQVNLDGIWDLRPFFDAAVEAGIYLIARPGPYINAEVSAGGFPGWLLRVECILRSNCSEYEDATKNYLSTIGKVIADAEVTKGGPVILVQPENEYSTWPDVAETEFPLDFNIDYMAFVEEQLREAGSTVPFIDNDNKVLGNFAPGTGLGAVDLYGIDSYPVRYDCSQPDVWPTYRWPVDWQVLHEEQSPSTPFAIPEFQGGTATSWGSVGQDMCAALVGPEALRVFYKNNYSFGVKIMNIYMTYGGTNWGNLGYMGGDTSYDYGASITEGRQVWREKFSEQKLQANFFKVSPGYLTARPGNEGNGTYAFTSDVGVTPLLGEQGMNFYVVRHADFTSNTTVKYRLELPTSAGNITIPQLGGDLSLIGRDAKLIVTDYAVGEIKLIYSTADIFTWATGTSGKTVLILYGTAGELHEFSLPVSSGRPVSLGHDSSVIIKQRTSGWVVQWTVTPAQQVIHVSEAGLEIRLLWRNDAFDYWVLELPKLEPIGNFSSPSKSVAIVKGGYLMRTAALDGPTLLLTGDFNATTDTELVFEPTGKVDSLTINGEALQTRRSDLGTLVSRVTYTPPTIRLPDFAALTWHAIDSLPEISPGESYDDSLWTVCNHTTSTNNQRNLSTPTSLYASDYGYHAGSLLYRGHFTSTGSESELFLNVSGGYAFSHSVLLDSTFLGSWVGSPDNKTYAQTFPLPTNTTAGVDHVITVLMDHMGQDEEAPGTDAVKYPMGILDYALYAHPKGDVQWKLTGNLGGEDYVDRTRGPRNEGGMFAERKGYHLPVPPVHDASLGWTVSSPISSGLSGPGVRFYSTTFELHVPDGYDVPLSFVFANNTGEVAAYRVQLFVNGYQYGKFIPYMGPQSEFPVPEGILNYGGTNYVGLTLWALEEKGARLGGLSLEASMPVMSSMKRPGLAPQPVWELRPSSY
ncbi:putative beta-galactosidase E [Cytospora mali]|uniref:Beta-galactosidase n=1 Tax=Cytospora mali TaxID=578113 RepID=A0A194WC98_CYTMA|nr:putative beta-galactosidase E [Valsa mali]